MANRLGLKMRLSAVDKMSSAIRKVSRSFKPLRSSIDKTNRKFKIMQGRSEKLRKSLSKTGGKMRGVGAAMTLGLTAPIVAIGAAVIKTSADFSKAMNGIEAVTKVSGKSLEDMKKLAMDLGSETKFSAVEAANAMAFLGQANMNTGQIFIAMKDITNLAAASNTDLARTADIASNVLGAFGLKAKDMTRVADVMAQTTASANVDMGMLAETMAKAAPIAKKYGLSIEETSAAIGLLGNIGIQGSVAGTSLNNMMLKLAAPGSKAISIFKGLGVKAIDPTTGKMRKLNDILGDLGNAFASKKITSAKQLAILNEVFGKRAIAGGGELLTQALKIGKDGTNAITRFTMELKGAKGAAERMAKIRMKGLDGALTRLGSTTEKMLLVFGEKSGFIGVVEKLVIKLTDLANWISELSPATLKWAGIIAGLVAIIGPLIAAFGLFLTVLPSMITGWGLMVSGIAGVKLAILGLNAAMIPTIALAALFATAAFMIWKEWEPLKHFFSNLFDTGQIIDMIKWAGKLSGITSLFGLGDDTDAKLKAQGFKISTVADRAKGKALGARDVTKKSNDFKVNQQKAQIGVNFSNIPKGTSLITDDKDNIMDIIGTGLLGAN
ncbi:MAG: phage tail tape measure protein [Proteobacteria bacterium]|nr:phage tail tape measure protein [Pseudomonadota bacterium]